MRDAAFPIQSRASLVLKGGDDAAEFGMDARAMITLVVIFQDHFPVRGDVVAERLCRAQAGERIALYALDRPAELLGQRARALREIHEREPAPGVEGDGVQAFGRFGNVGGLDERRGDERSVEGVRPGVIRTANRAAHDALAAEQLGAAMPAEVQVGAKRAVLSAHHDDTLAGHVHDAEAAGLGPLLIPADAEPLVPKNRRLLAMVERVAPICRPRERRL